jgi:hypothetical protein
LKRRRKSSSSCREARHWRQHKHVCSVPRAAPAAASAGSSSAASAAAECAGLDCNYMQRSAARQTAGSSNSSSCRPKQQFLGALGLQACAAARALSSVCTGVIS